MNTSHSTDIGHVTPRASATSQSKTLSPQDRQILRHTDYRCHGCWQDLRQTPQSQWRVVAMPMRGRGGVGVGEHLLAVCAPCATRVAMQHQRPAPQRPIPVLAELAMDGEDLSMSAGVVGLLSGWFVAGPALALVGLVLGGLIGMGLARRGIVDQGASAQVGDRGTNSSQPYTCV